MKRSRLLTGLIGASLIASGSYTLAAGDGAEPKKSGTQIFNEARDNEMKTETVPENQQSGFEKIEQDIQGSIQKGKITKVGDLVKVTYDNDVLFGFDSTEIKGDAAGEIESLGETLRQHQNAKVVVHGHTDSQGDEAYNKILSQRRAETVADILEDNGVKEDQIEIKGHGEDDPVASNDTSVGRLQNRRVEISIQNS